MDTYDSNEAMYTKLKLGGSGYDIVFPSNYFLELMSQQNMLKTLSFEKLNLACNIDWDFVEKLGLQKNPFGIPFTASFTGVAYRSDRVLSPVHSWQIFGNKEYSGRMTMLNDMRDTMGAALICLGYSANSTDNLEINKAGLLIRHWKNNLAKLESEQYKNGIASGEYLVVQGYTSDCLQAAQGNPNVDFFYPKEGTTACIDFAAITQTSENVELAYTFLNFLLDPQIACENMEYTRCRAINKEARKYLSEVFRNSELMYPEDNADVFLQTISPVGEAQKDYLEQWNLIKNS
jgi:spermidine/putrescine transport system substrate-binding protein